MNYIDEARLTELGQFLDQDKLYTLLERYILDSRELLQNLAIALDASDAASAQRHAHSLKSTSANIGAMALSELALELENLGRAKRLEDIASHMDQLRRVFEHTHVAINSLPLTEQRPID